LLTKEELTVSTVAYGKEMLPLCIMFEWISAPTLCLVAPEFRSRSRDWLTEEYFMVFRRFQASAMMTSQILVRMTFFHSHLLTVHLVIWYVIGDNDDTINLLLLFLLLTFYWVSGK
jgi:hypothetical protein